MATPNDIYDELRELSPALHELKKQVRQPKVPAGYFDSVADSVMAQVQESTPAILSGIDRHRKPAVPEPYFDTLADQVMQKIRAQEQTIGHGRPEPESTGLHILYLRQLAVAATVLGIIALGYLLFDRQTIAVKDCADGIACLTREEIRQYVHDHADEFETEQIQEVFPVAIELEETKVSVAEEDLATAPVMNDAQIEQYIKENPATIDFEDPAMDIF